MAVSLRDGVPSYLGAGIARVRAWQIWAHPRRVMSYFLFWDLAAAFGVAASLVWFRLPTGTDWLRFGLLLGCATVHVTLTRRQEESIRSRNPTPHVDVTTMWTYAAVVVLPPSAAIAAAIAVLAQRWFIARRPLHRQVATSAMLISSILISKIVIGAIGTGDSTDLEWVASARGLAAAAVGGLLYVGCQALIVAGAIELIEKPRPSTALFGGGYENWLEVFGVGLGIVISILLWQAPLTVLVMIPVAVVINYVSDARQIRMDARTDPKTDLLNMRGWQVAAERELARAERGGSSTGLLMIDFDHFKEINDSWGHPAGDDVLVALAGALREETRPADVVGRFGGEEFVVLLPSADRYEAAAVAERILKRVRQLRVTTTDKRGGPIVISGRTTSIGVASHPADAETLPTLIQASDAAVYEAKETGRDRACQADPHSGGQ